MIYDEFQKKSIDYIEQGSSVIVSAPTGAGKTVIAEYIIKDCLNKNEKLIYTAPIKALSNQKYRDFKGNFSDKIGILTGDVNINASAPVLIMTTEIFRNKILEQKSDLEDYSWIIFDEVHYIDDYQRGSVWEEALMFMPDKMKVLALSATIPNIDELSSWFMSIHKRPLKTIKENKRPVPLHFFFQTGGQILDNIHRVKKVSYRHNRYSGHHKSNKTTSLIRHLHETDKLPCIYFSFGRRRCEYLANEMGRFDFLNPDEKKSITAMYDNLCEKYDLSGDTGAQSMRNLIERGVGYHHAGMLPTLKEVVECLFTSRLLKVIFTTETFALGINMPARSVIFDELRKFYGKSFDTLKTRDFYQMAGRAGRRGIDREGFVYSRVNPRYTSFQELKRILYGEPEKVRSRFNASYGTILNLYERYGEKLYDIYPLSFHYFQAKNRIRRKAVELMHAKVNILKELGYIRKNKITEKGFFAQKIYGYELSLSELYEQGSMNDLSPVELGIMATALVFEPRKNSHQAPLTGKTKYMSKICERTVSRIQRIEKKLGIKPMSKAFHFNLTRCIEAWMSNEEFDSILRHTDSDEGEIIRYFRMAIQILREMLETPSSPDFKSRVKKAIYLINRDIIDAEKQLRT